MTDAGMYTPDDQGDSSLSVTERRKVIAERARTDFPFFARNALVLRSKSEAMLPFDFNEAQTFLHRLVEDQKRRKGYVRIIVLKGRQQGVSTYIGGRYTWAAATRRGVRAFILTHEQEATNNIFEMVERFYDNLPAHVKPSTSRANAKELKFASLDSGFKVGTAGTKGIGRSQTLQFFHGSEVAFWPHAATHAAGIIQCVPLEPGTEIFLESTANGVGGFFYDKWQAAELGVGEYQAIFIPWYWQREYRIKNYLGKSFEPTGDEQLLMKRFGWDIEQVLWRRYKITEIGELLFRQEYPNTAEEAFIFSGNSFFPADVRARVVLELQDPIAVGYLEQAGETVRFIQSDNGYLEVFQKPDNVNGQYTCGLDVSEGLPHGDLNSGHIIKRGLIAEQVARFTPMTEPDETGRIAVRVCKYYGGNVPLGIERNSIGVASVIAARDAEYPHLFRMPTQHAAVVERKGYKLGWITSNTSRSVLAADLLQSLRDGTLVVRSKQTMKQIETFVRNERGKPEAASGCKDDDIIGLGIAYQMLLRTDPISDVSDSESHLRLGGGGGFYAR